MFASLSTFRQPSHPPVFYDDYDDNDDGDDDGDDGVGYEAVADVDGDEKDDN